MGFSLDSIPGLCPLLCHFAVTPSRFRPRPRGSLDLVEEKRSVVSDRRRASAGKSGSGSSARKWRRKTHRTIAWCTLGTCGVALFRGFRHRSKRTFGRSRRDLAICVAGTPGCRLRPTTPRARPAFPLLKLNLPVRTGTKTSHVLPPRDAPCLWDRRGRSDIPTTAWDFGVSDTQHLV